MVELIVRPDLGKRAYRLRCRFKVGANPTPAWLEKAKYMAAEQFVRDMRKQGYEYLGAHGFKMKGPFIPLQVVNLPSRRNQERWQVPSREMLAGLRAGKRYRASEAVPGVLTTRPVVEQTDWEYELAGVFVHKTILCETPSMEEERRELAKR